RVREDGADNTGRQSLLLAFFLAPLDIDVNVVRVSPLLLLGVLLLPETAPVGAFTVGQMLGEIRVHIAANLFDLGYGRLQRILFSKWQFFHAAQEGDEVIKALVHQEQAFVEAQLRGMCGRLRGKRGPDTFVISHRCLLRRRLWSGARSVLPTPSRPSFRK